MRSNVRAASRLSRRGVAMPLSSPSGTPFKAATPLSSSTAATSAMKSCASCTFALHLTRPLLRTYKPQNRFEVMESTLEHGRRGEDVNHHRSSALELNLMEDPTAGLATGPAEELTPTELETRVRVLVSSYAPSLYRLLYTPFIDVVGILVRERLVPDGQDVKQATTTTTTVTGAGSSASPVDFPAAATSGHYAEGGAASATNVLGGHGGGAVAAGAGVGASPTTVSTNYRPVRPEEIMSRWFTDGSATLKHPHSTAEAMGKKRWSHFCRAMEAHWSDMEAVMPLTRVVRRHRLREDLYVPLLRQLAMELADPTKRTAAVATLPGFILSLANGRAPRSLGLPERDTERIPLVSELFLGVAQETGNTDLAYLALQLLRANNMETPFAAQKQLTNVFAAASRIETDWQMRGASLLSECYGKWMDYLREAQQDNMAALEKLDAARAADEAQEKEAEESTLGSTAVGSDSVKGTAAVSEGEGDENVESAEQYRYFTSRRQDDITRINALEENIEAAVRARAAELQGVRRRRRRVRRGTSEKAAAVSSDLEGEALSSAAENDVPKKANSAKALASALKSNLDDDDNPDAASAQTTRRGDDGADVRSAAADKEKKIIASAITSAPSSLSDKHQRKLRKKKGKKVLHGASRGGQDAARDEKGNSAQLKADADAGKVQQNTKEAIIEEDTILNF